MDDDCGSYPESHGHPRNNLRNLPLIKHKVNEIQAPLPSINRVQEGDLDVGHKQSATLKAKGSNTLLILYPQTIVILEKFLEVNGFWVEILENSTSKI